MLVKKSELNSLRRQLRTFSDLGHRYQGSHFNTGLGCHEWSWPIVESVATRYGPTQRERYPLSRAVGYETAGRVRDGFTWPTVMRIMNVMGADNQKSTTPYLIERCRREYPMAIATFSSREPPNVHESMKAMLQDMAKILLFIESLSFMESLGWEKEFLNHRA